MIDLRKYVVGGKPKNTEEFLLGKTAMKKVDEDCYILVIPQSVWDELKKEMPK